MFKKAMDVKTLLETSGYTVKSISGKNIDVSVAGNRVDVLKAIAAEFGGKYNPKGGSSSIGRTELPGNFFVNAKPASGGGSGAGSDITELAESSQCLYNAAIWYGDDFSGESLRDVVAAVDVSARIDDIIIKLPDHWIKSCITTAQKLHKEFKSKRYKFHRGSSWVESLENHWKNLNRVEKEFSNLNKWSPADIYMVSQKGERIDLTKTKTILELNTLMKKYLNDGDIIGVSLKQVKDNATLAYKNVTADRHTYKFESLTIGKRGFFMSGDSYVMYDGGEIQFRTFGSTWQGEIKGKTANMGKISGGPISNVLKRNGITLLQQNQIIDKKPEHVDLMYDFYKHFEGSKALDKKEFLKELMKKDQNYWVSKFLGAQLMYYIDKSDDATKNSIVSGMISYAASESELSGPYVKVS